MTKLISTPSTQNRQVSAEAMLRDLAYVLRLTKTVKSEILGERATISSDSPLFPPVEPESCAI